MWVFFPASLTIPHQLYQRERQTGKFCLSYTREHFFLKLYQIECQTVCGAVAEWTRRRGPDKILESQNPSTFTEKSTISKTFENLFAVSVSLMSQSTILFFEGSRNSQKSVVALHTKRATLKSQCPDTSTTITNSRKNKYLPNAPIWYYSSTFGMQSHYRGNFGNFYFNKIGKFFSFFFEKKYLFSRGLVFPQLPLKTL